MALNDLISFASNDMKNIIQSQQIFFKKKKSNRLESKSKRNEEEEGKKNYENPLIPFHVI